MSGMGGSKSESTGRSQQAQNIWGAQSPYLQDLYSQGQDTLGQAMQQNQQMMPQINEAYGNMIQPQGNPYLDQMAQGGLGQMQRNFGQTLAQIRGGAVSAGQLGSSRQGVAEGIAAQDMGTQTNNYLANLYGGNYQQDQNRAAGALQFAPQMAAQQFAPLAAYQQILGAPVALGSGSSANDSKSKSFSG